MTPSYFKAKHGYEIDGLWYPRVTSICRIIAKPALEKWLANQKSFSAMERKRKKIIEWGILVHETLEKILLGENTTISPKIRPSVDAFLDWLQRHKVRAFEAEKRVLSKKHFYSGTLDVLAEIDGRLGILDLKTSSEIWDDYFIQTAAYFQAYNEKNSKKAKTYWILRVDQYQKCMLCGAEKRNKNGEIDIKKNNKKCNHEWSDPKGVFELREVKNKQIYITTFLNAKKVWEFANRHLLSKITNYPGKGSLWI